MKVTIIGSHGIPSRYGGFETFAEHLAMACVKAGIKIKVVNEKANPHFPIPENIEIVSSSYNKSQSPLKFYKDSLKLAADSDIILSCGVGGAFFYRSFRSQHVKIITNLDSLEHKRGKYSMLQRLVVYLLQSRAAKQSDLLIADSQEIWGYFISRFPKLVNKFKAIRYGANECLTFQETDLEKYKVVKNEYFLVIARLVSENKADEIIRAYKQYIGRKKLLIVGAVENTAFVRNLKTLSNGKIVFADAIYDKQILDSLRQGCFIYIHGHSVGGTNPSLLEAMAAGCACLCHDNVFNLEVTEGNQIYFHSSYDLAILLNLLEHKSNDLDVLRIKALDRVKNKYTWDQICKSYIDLFHQLHSQGITDNNN